jgi:hypothetical protein
MWLNCFWRADGFSLMRPSEMGKPDLLLSSLISYEQSDMGKQGLPARLMKRTSKDMGSGGMCIASRESSSISLPIPSSSCSPLTGPSHLKRFPGLSRHSKPLSSQRQEDDHREAERRSCRRRTARQWPRPAAREKSRGVSFTQMEAWHATSVVHPASFLLPPLSDLDLGSAVLAALLHHPALVPLSRLLMK